MAAATAVELDLTDVQAKKVVKLAIEHGAYSDDMPDTKKGRLEAATEAVEYCVDSWVNDSVRPDDEDEDIAAAGEAILTIFEAAGIEVDEEGNLVTGEAEAEDDDDDTGDAEAPFDPDDYFEDGYTELTPASKLKALAELDLEDEDTVNVIAQIKDWEDEQDKPSSRVLSWIEDNLELGDVTDEDDDDDAEAEAEGGEDEEPWEGYDKASAVDIKKTLDEAAADEDEPLTAEQLEYVKEYEEARKAPRKRVLDKVDELLVALEDEPKPKKGVLGKKPAAKKPAAKVAAESSGNGEVVITLTREQILTALDAGEVEIEVG